ncbi:MAG: orotidine 5'-phosphate decarboxylase [Candidatus Rokubacteria bacterium]|nr:orotidine 5'-phosphate decarboxylase [Candidatus Rokubacteria bacterium]
MEAARQPVDARHGVVCACDLDDLDAIARLLEAIDPVEGLVGYKLGSLLTLRYGLGAVVRAFRKATAKTLFYDHQKAGLDIPSMAAEYAAACRDAGVDALILFPLGGPRALDAFVGETLRVGLRPVVGGALPLPDYLLKGGGYVAASALPRIIDRAFGLGARDFIIPATDGTSIRREAARLAARGGARLYLPGIGPLGGQLEAAFAAARPLATYAIVGRAIYADPRPAAAARRLAGAARAFAQPSRAAPAARHP